MYNCGVGFYVNQVKNFSHLSEEIKTGGETRSRWLNCALRDDEAVYWVSIGHYEAVAVGDTGDTGSVEGICAFIN